MSSRIDEGFFVGLPGKALFGYPVWMVVAVMFMGFSASPSFVDFLNSVMMSQLTPSAWFQRSGAVGIAMGVVIEALILNRFDLDIRGTPTHETERGFLSSLERKYLNWCQAGALALVIFGTAVSGYGDIIHAAYFG